jgi:2-amino-4-hydroxy-6-hydroxymethyldihydropteridine diphosphokinase
LSAACPDKGHQKTTAGRNEERAMPAPGIPPRQTVYLSMGSNVGDRMANLKGALGDLADKGQCIRRISSFYSTEPVGYLSQPWFLNIAVEFETTLPPRALLEICQAIEHARGRERSFPGAPRIIDLDILLYGDLVVNEPGVQIPHPRMAARRFVLEPLAEIAPEAVHPTLKISIQALLASCSDRSSVIRCSTGGPS